MEQIKTVEIKDICLGIYEGPHATPKNSDTGGIYLGIPALDPKGFIDYSRAKRIAEEDLPLWTKRVTPQEDDIVFTNEATLNLYAIIPANFHGCLGRRLGLIRPNKDLVNVKYLFYYFFSPEWRETVAKNKVSGATVDRILMTKFPSFPVALPSLKTQERIANILSVIDAKIEVNRQINDNLEQQASSLLSDWISTYPCRTYKLSDICKYANAKCETGNLTPQNYISTENMLPNKKGIVEASNIPTGKATCFKVDDILIANIRPYFQKIWKADINGGCSADVLCIRANIESHSPILYWLLHQDAFFEYVMTGAKGCKMPRGDKQHIMNWSIDLPEVQYWADLATQLGSIDQQIAYNRIESINLSNLRDTLLPKLMSGEIKINEIDC